MKNHYIQSKQEALVKYQEAEREKREAEKKYRHLKTYCWVPIYGQYLAVRKIVEENNGKARAALREMACHERDVEEAKREIERTNSVTRQVSCKLTMANMFSSQNAETVKYVCLHSMFPLLHIMSSFEGFMIVHEACR